MLADLVRDFRYAGRSLARTPGFTVVAVAVLALGIGATSAIFSLVSAVWLRPLPFVDADRLVTLWDDFSADRRAAATSAPAPAISSIGRSAPQSFESMARDRARELQPDRRRRRARTARGRCARTPSLFATIGLVPLSAARSGPRTARGEPVVVIAKVSGYVA